MKVRLGINTGFAVNRFSAAQEWIPLVGDVFGLRIVQMTADLLSPSLPAEIIRSQIKKINQLSRKHHVEIKHTFTGAFTRLNHLAHPDKEIRDHWLKWFYKFVDISIDVGAESMGSHFGILTQPDCDDAEKRQTRFFQNVEAWQKIAQYAKGRGLKYLLWEPMSVPREMGETLLETRRIQAIVNDHIALPMKLCLDVDHGDVSSTDPDDTDPYVWIKEFAKESPLIHIKQSLKNKGGHWPFIPEKNKDGKIRPFKMIKALEKAGVKDVTLLLELSFRERQPFDRQVVDHIKASIEYWRPFVSI